MFKRIIIMAVVSAFVIYFAGELSNVLHAFGSVQIWLFSKVDGYFPTSKWLQLLFKTIVLVAVPVLVSLIPAFFYWLVKRKEMPALEEIAWILWIIFLMVFMQ